MPLTLHRASATTPKVGAAFAQLRLPRCRICISVERLVVSMGK